MKNKKIISVLVLFCAFIFLFILIANKNMPNDIYGSSALSNEYKKMKLKRFRFEHVSYTENNGETNFNFNSNSVEANKNKVLVFEFTFRKLAPNSLPTDIIETEISKITKVTTDYFKENPKSNLNNYKIALSFRIGNSDEFYYVSNFNMDTFESYENPYDFQYVEISVNYLPSIEEFSNAKKLKLGCYYIDKNEDMSIFDNFENLEYLAYGGDFTKEQINYLRQTHPNCKLINLQNTEESWKDSYKLNDD